MLQESSSDVPQVIAIKSPGSSAKKLKQARLPFMGLDKSPSPATAEKRRKLADGEPLPLKTVRRPSLDNNQLQKPSNNHGNSKKRQRSSEGGLVAHSNDRPGEVGEVQVTSSSELDGGLVDDKPSKAAKMGSLDAFVKPIVIRDDASITSTTDAKELVDLTEAEVEGADESKTNESDRSLNESSGFDSSVLESGQENDENRPLVAEPGSVEGLTAGAGELENSRKPKKPRARKVNIEKQKKKEQEQLEKNKEKEAAKAEKERLKEEEKEKKDAIKEELRLKKEKEREEKEKEKLEKLQQKEEEKKKKQEQIDLKNEEKKRKEEEKKKKEEEKKKKDEDKLREEEELQRRNESQKSFFTNFFVKTGKPAKEQEVAKGPFMAFEVKRNMRMAPKVRNSNPDLEILDKHLHGQDCSCLYLNELKSGHKPMKSTTTWPYEDPVTVISETMVKGHYKLLKFDKNTRPEYWGTWRKKSTKLSARNPWRKDTDLFDYELDSDAEWEEEEPGESLSNSEGEDDGEEKADEDDDDGFFVPHGHLSDDEINEDEEDMSPGALKVRQKLKQRQWEIEMKKSNQTSAIKPVIIGCYWLSEGALSPAESTCNPFLRYKACLLASQPILTSYTKPIPPVTPKSATTAKVEKGKGALKRPVPKEAMPYLIRLVHGNRHSIVKIIEEFKQFWTKRVSEEGATEERSTPGIEAMDVDRSVSSPARQGTPDTIDAPNTSNEGFISKRQLEMKIHAIAVYEKRAQVYGKKCWFIHDDPVSEYGLDGKLPVPNQWEYITLAPPTASQTGRNTTQSPAITQSIKQYAVATSPGANTGPSPSSGLKNLQRATSQSPNVNSKSAACSADDVTIISFRKCNDSPGSQRSVESEVMPIAFRRVASKTGADSKVRAPNMAKTTPETKHASLTTNPYINEPNNGIKVALMNAKDPTSTSTAGSIVHTNSGQNTSEMNDENSRGIIVLN